MSTSSTKVSSHLLKKIVFSLFRNKIWNYIVKKRIDYLFRKISLNFFCINSTYLLFVFLICFEPFHLIFFKCAGTFSRRKQTEKSIKYISGLQKQGICFFNDINECVIFLVF